MTETFMWRPGWIFAPILSPARQIFSEETKAENMEDIFDVRRAGRKTKRDQS